MDQPFLATHLRLPKYDQSDTVKLMKVAISLPDPLFSAAEHLAEQLHVSRSQLYAQALAEYLERRQENVVRERLNAVYGLASEGVEPAMQKAQLKVLDNEAW